MLGDLDHISFAEWLLELNSCAYDAGYIDGPLVRITGQLCWYSYYEQGLDPGTALEAAAQDGMEFGADYRCVIDDVLLIS